MRTRLTWEQAMAEAQRQCDLLNVDFNEARRVVSNHLSDQLREQFGADHGHGISSSDVNHHLVGLVECGELPEVLRDLAERNALVQRVAASTGKDFGETLAALQELFS